MSGTFTTWANASLKQIVLKHTRETTVPILIYRKPTTDTHHAPNRQKKNGKLQLPRVFFCSLSVEAFITTGYYVALFRQGFYGVDAMQR